MSIESHRDLVVWQKTVELVTDCYRLTSGFPADERFGLTQQLRRAAVCVPANIAEGKGRGGANEFIRFINIANGSLTEVDTHIVIAESPGFISHSQAESIVERVQEVGRMLTGLRKSLERNAR